MELNAIRKLSLLVSISISVYVLLLIAGPSGQQVPVPVGDSPIVTQNRLESAEIPLFPPSTSLQSLGAVDPFPDRTAFAPQDRDPRVVLAIQTLLLVVLPLGMILLFILRHARQ